MFSNVRSFADQSERAQGPIYVININKFTVTVTEALAELMVTVVELNPNCCNSSHLSVLFAAYSASLSTTGEHTYCK